MLWLQARLLAESASLPHIEHKTEGFSYSREHEMLAFLQVLQLVVCAQ